MHKLYEEAAEDAGREGTEEDGYLTAGAEVLCDFGVFAKRESVDKDAHGESDTSKACNCKEHGPGGSFGHFTDLALDGEEAGEGDADRFT